MRLFVRSLNQSVTLHGHPVQVWLGTTDGGVPVHLMVARVQGAETLPVAQQLHQLQLIKQGAMCVIYSQRQIGMYGTLQYRVWKGKGPLSAAVTLHVVGLAVLDGQDAELLDAMTRGELTTMPAAPGPDLVELLRKDPRRN